MALMVRRRARWLPRRSGASEQLVDEVGAFVGGTLAELYEVRGGRVPVWAWTNLLAHGDRASLRDAHGRDYQAAGFEDRWRAARSYLAGEVLSLADQCGSLDEAQRRVLGPLELRLATDVKVDWWEPTQWVSTVVTALEAERRVHRR
ncbi:MAG: hypothetical protein ACYCX8_12610 [Acidimicrobiales bacterium]